MLSNKFFFWRLNTDLFNDTYLKCSVKKLNGLSFINLFSLVFAEKAT